MGSCFTYLLYSVKLGKYYVGSTQDVNSRLNYHNNGNVKFTSRGIPWILVWSQQCMTRAEAVQLENKIKKRGAKRYLTDLGLLER